MLSYEILSGNSYNDDDCDPDEENYGMCGPDWGADCEPDCDPAENDYDCSPY